MPPLPSIGLDALFRNPHMFDNKEAFHAEGFDVKQAHAHNIMVGSHPSAPKHLFKKYSRGVPLDAQRANYETRAEGAQKIRRFVEEQRLQHMVVPQKWIFDLPPRFALHGKISRLLIVERMDILDSKENEKRYHAIGENVLEELCRVLCAFRGLDAAVHNVRFTSSGQIAFIDTENWKRRQQDVFHYIRQALSESSRKRAERMFQKLNAAEQRRQIGRLPVSVSVSVSVPGRGRVRR